MAGYIYSGTGGFFRVWRDYMYFAFRPFSLLAAINICGKEIVETEN